jgi:hypothetical protein
LKEREMTESEWQACRVPDPMLAFLDDVNALTDRKQRLHDCACVRRIWHLLLDEDGRRAVELAEGFADGLVDIVDLREIQGVVLASRDVRIDRNVLAMNRGESLPHPPDAVNSVCVLGAAAAAAWEFRTGAAPLSQAASALSAVGVTDHGYDGRRQINEQLLAEQAHQVVLLRDVFGNPFRPVEFSPDWQTETVVLLARQMYDSRDFSAMPILADALMDAGCDNADVLDHCRGPGPHVRGCWVVDLMLGKE